MSVTTNPSVTGSPAATGQTPGTTTSDSATAGNVGELITASQGDTISMTTNVTNNVTNISLTPGDWDVSGVTDFLTTSSTSWTELLTGISTTSGGLGGTGSYTQLVLPAQVPGAVASSLPTPNVRMSLAATTTVYLIAFTLFTVSTMNCGGTIRARRVR